MAIYKTFDEYVKGEKIVRYIDVFKCCWNFATDAAEENGSSHNKQSTPCLHVNQHPVNNNLGYCRKCDDCGAYL